MTQAQATVQPGTVLLGKYIVERVLGAGGMGVVVAARHMELGELFAIKLMQEAALEQAEPVERFLREARASARLKGEHAVRVHDVGRLPNGAPYMIMEHLAGQDLKQVLRARGPLPFDEATRFVMEACEAVAEAHSLGVVHRDLKPANLFLARRPNGTACVKVLDFGISKELDPEQRVGADLTRTGSFLGSPNYMSPEQMTRIKDADARSDIWSIGVVLFQLLTDELPFKGTVLTEVVARVLTDEPIRPAALRNDIPPELEAIVMRCLEKKPERRFQSVNELMAALAPFTAAGGHFAFGRPTAFSMADTAQRGPLPAPIATIEMAPAVAPAAAPTAAPRRAESWSASRAPTELPTGRGWGHDAIAPQKTNKAGVTAALVLALVLLGGGGAYFIFRGLPGDDTNGDVATSTASTSAAGETSPSATSALPASASTAASSAAASALPSTVAPVKARATAAPARTAAGTSTKRKLPGFDD